MNNIADILKDVPKGTKLYSPIFGEVVLYSIGHDKIITVKSFYNDTTFSFNMWGQYYGNIGECLLFPSKEVREWDNFSIKKEYNFKPFDKVVVRLTSHSEWTVDLFGYYRNVRRFPYQCGGDAYNYCLPYNEETAKLIGTTNDYIE